jgi:hypothetical protein
MRAAFVSHPHNELLMEFGQSRLAAEPSLLIEQHVEVCHECCELLFDLKGDTFVELAKVAPGNDDLRRSLSALSEMAISGMQSEISEAGRPRNERLDSWRPIPDDPRLQ